MAADRRPISLRAMFFVHAGFVYIGALFVYMGNSALSAKYRILSSGTILTESAMLVVGVGCASIVSGLAGLGVTFYRVKPRMGLLTVHAVALACLALLFLASAALGLVMYFQSTLWTTSYCKPPNVYFGSPRPTCLTSFGEAVCPTLLGYTCHSVELSDPVEDYWPVQRRLLPSLQGISGEWRTYSSTGGNWYGMNASVAAALSMGTKNSGRFIDLCSNVSARMELLGPAKRLAKELKGACDVCKAVAPVQEVPPWIDVGVRSSPRRSEDDYLYVNAAETFQCIRQLFPAEAVAMSSNSGFYWNLPESDLTPETKFWDEWISFATSISIGSAISFVSTALLVYEAREASREMPASTE